MIPGNGDAARIRDLAERLGSTVPRGRAVIGFDGFVDEITRVVDTRESPERYSTIRTIADFGERIARSAGKNTNFEYVTVTTKMGGNGTIMANALGLLGVDLTCIGTLGSPDLHPVYRGLAERSETVSLGPPARTEALEFDDGKLITSRLEALRAVTWERLIELVPAPSFVSMIERARLFAPMNWTMLPHLGDMLDRFSRDVLPQLDPGGDRYLYADLSDPEKRTPADLRRVLEILALYTGRFRVILGMNIKEIGHLCGASGIDCGDGAAAAGNLAGRYGFHGIALHSRLFASWIPACGTAERIDSPFTDAPLLSTGAGDNFNAGFAFGLLADLPPADSLILGCAVAGSYVRTGESPDREGLQMFLRRWSAGNPERQ